MHDCRHWIHGAMTRRLVAALALALAGLLLGGCEGPGRLPVTPNVLRDGSGTRLLAQLPPEQRTVAMPVVYVTDRAPVEGSATGVRYGSHRSPSMAYGLATVALDPSPTWDELAQAAGSAPGGRRYGLSVARIEERGQIRISPASLEVYEGNLRFRPDVAEQIAREAQRFRDLVGARLAGSRRKDVYIYVHGVNNSFEDAVCRTAMLWHYTGRQGVAVAYAWPAGRSGLLGYFMDRESGEYTVMHLKRLLTALAQCPDVERLHIIAHSRGCDVTITALRELNLACQARGQNAQRELKLETLVLAAGDMDVEVFGLRATLENLAVIARRFVIYSSTHDQVVALAHWIFQSRVRLGTLSKDDLVGPAQELLAHLPNVQAVQCVVWGFGDSHDYMFTNPGALSDLILVLRDQRDPGAAHGRPLTPLGGAFWKLDNQYALPADKPGAP